MIRVTFLFAFCFAPVLVAAICPHSLLKDQVESVEMDSSHRGAADEIVRSLIRTAMPTLESLKIPEPKKTDFLFRMKQILEAGVGNAVEWGNQFRSGSTVEITFRYIPWEFDKLGGLVFSIRDQGDGYDPGDTAHLFTCGNRGSHRAERERRGIRPGGKGFG